MEHGAEMQRGKGAIFADNIRKWAHERLTVKGRTEVIFQKKYDEVLKSLPEGVTENQMALLELRLQNLAKSRAIGSIVVDAVFTGTAVVGTGMLLSRLADKKGINLSPTQRAAFQRMDERGARALKMMTDAAQGGFRVGKQIAEGAANAALFPFRVAGDAAKWLWGVTLGPVVGAAVDLADAAAQTSIDTVEAIDYSSDWWARQGEKAVNAVRGRPRAVGAAGTKHVGRAHEDAVKKFTKKKLEWSIKGVTMDPDKRGAPPKPEDFLK